MTIIENESGTPIDIELDKGLIDFYKHETGKSRVTKRGITKFFQHLLEIKTYIL